MATHVQSGQVDKVTVLAAGSGQDRWGVVGDWIEEAGFVFHYFQSAGDILSRLERVDVGIVLLDAAVPGFYRIIESMKATPSSQPIIVLTETFERDCVVQAFRCGAIDVMEFPIDRHQLLERLAEAARVDTRRAPERRLYRRLTRLMGSLTRREREVMQCVVEGNANKQIAAVLNISEKTVEVHRHKVMRKMEADSLAALVRMNMVIEASAAAIWN